MTSGMLVVAICLGLSSAARVRTSTQVFGEDSQAISFDEDEMVKDSGYTDLMQKRRETYFHKNEHTYTDPSRIEGEYYWEKENGKVVERCCCPKIQASGEKPAGLQCKYLHAFSHRSDSYMNLPLGLKRSSDPRRWNAWVCPGTTGIQEGIGWHHSEDVTECEAVKEEIRLKQEDWDEEESNLVLEVDAVNAEVKALTESWGCTMIGEERIDGTYCGKGGLWNVHNCGKKGQKGKCYTTACYKCKKTGAVFHKRKGDGMVKDESTGKKYISTTLAVTAYALEQCRRACIDA